MVIPLLKIPYYTVYVYIYTRMYVWFWPTLLVAPEMLLW